VAPRPGWAVIFDMDGVLVDSEPLTVRAYAQAASEFGVRLDPEEFLARVAREGMLVRSFLEQRGMRASDWPGLFARKTQLYRALARQELRPMPGAVALLEKLQRRAVPCALATAASRITMEIVVAAQGLARYFQATVALEDVARPKPDPEAFLRAAELLGMPPGRCVVVEDAPKGVAAARAAGMACVVVSTPLLRAGEGAGADCVVGSLGELSVGRLTELVERRGREAPAAGVSGARRGGRPRACP